MKTLLFSLLLAVPGILNAGTPRHYSISVNGPVAAFEFSCDDPCELDAHEVVGSSGGEVSRSTTGKASSAETVVTGTRIKRKRNTNPAEHGIQCMGECATGSKNMRLTFEARRTLREGIKVTIADGRAHFVFYSVVDTEKGPATRSQQSSFRIDRPLIQLDLHGHEVEILTDMENTAKTNWLADRNR